MASWHWADSDKRFFQLLCAKINPCFTAGKQSGVGTCQFTCGHRKTTIIASIGYGCTCHQRRGQPPDAHSRLKSVSVVFNLHGQTPAEWWRLQLGTGTNEFWKSKNSDSRRTPSYSGVQKAIRGWCWSIWVFQGGTWLKYPSQRLQSLRQTLGIGCHSVSMYCAECTNHILTCTVPNTGKSCNASRGHSWNTTPLLIRYAAIRRL